MMMIRAVRCHEFAAIEQILVPNSSHGKSSTPQPIISFRPRKQPKRLADVLSLDYIPRPRLSSSNHAKNDELLIKVCYAGIQYPDALQAQGLYQMRPTLPYIPAMDATGIVMQVSDNNNNNNSDNNNSNNSTSSHDDDDLKVGDRVIVTMLACGGTGGMAEIIKVPSSQVYKIPSNVPLYACSNIGRNYFAAYHSLKTIGKIHHIIQNSGNSNAAGSSSSSSCLVLVDGASGGVGMATIEMAKALGCKVIAAVSSVEKMQPCRQVGANAVLCYGRDKASYQRFKNEVRQVAKMLGHSQGVDLIVDMVQGELFEAALVSCVRPLGTIALVGFAAGQVPIRPGLLLIKEINVVGSLWGRWAAEFPQQHAQNVGEILQLLSSGAIKPRVDRIFSVQDFVQAFELFETNQGRGNTVVSFGVDEAAASDDDNKYKEDGILQSKL
jgi:NADPH:quinone reductase